MSRVADDYLARHPEVRHEDLAWPAFIQIASRAMAPFAVWFRFSVEGLERVPSPSVLVANHSCGAIFEIMLLLRAWSLKFPGRPIRAMTHRISWQIPPLRIARWIGGVYAHPDVARAVLGRGQTLAVFPGGDVDTFRPFSARDEVWFAGRTGFAKIAREANVPVIPLAISGSHACWVILPGAERLARALRLTGVKALGLPLGFVLTAALGVATLAVPELLPWLLAAFVFMLVPAPTRIEARALEPMRPREGESAAEFAERVRATLEAAVKEMSRKRWTPWG
jgi:1-acyl-sn-glycerol-3-phosphate acyltransferase